MFKSVLKIEGMACGMCEVHINDCIRRQFPVKKVSSSFKKGETVVISESPLDVEKVKAAVAATGYRVLEVSQSEETPTEKHGLFAKFKKH